MSKPNESTIVKEEDADDDLLGTKKDAEDMQLQRCTLRRENGAAYSSKLLGWLRRRGRAPMFVVFGDSLFYVRCVEVRRTYWGKTYVWLGWAYVSFDDPLLPIVCFDVRVMRCCLLTGACSRSGLGGAVCRRVPFSYQGCCCVVLF